MKNVIRATSLYTFLRYCNESSLEKEVLDCGAGGAHPPLSLFYEHGYKTHGIEISEERLKMAEQFCREHNMELEIVKGDMREIPFDDESMSFVYSYNTIFHLNKADIAVAMREIERVLKTGGLCFVNFLSIDDSEFGAGEQLGEGEFIQNEAGAQTIHSYHEDNAPNMYFTNFEIMRKEKRVLELWMDGEKHIAAFIDYVAKKKRKA